MTAIPRVELPGLAHHIVQRGVNRQPCFGHPSNYARYLEYLQLASSTQGCAIHAYVLMTNHVHLLATPTGEGALGRMMQQLGSRYVRYYNACTRRTGTLWEGRFRACVVDSDRYFLACQRYIELNPVRAGMVAAAGDYRWSSHRCNAGGIPDPVVTPHASYLALAEADEPRRRTYQALVTTDAERTAIRDHLTQGRAWGSDDFQARVEAACGRPMATRARGRPRNK